VTTSNKILTALEIAILSETYIPPEPLSGDKWIMSSCMQKSVRRQDTETAIRAATSLWLQDRQNFWRRLHIIACEDVSIGDVETVVKVLTATASSAWRRQVGDLRVGLYLTRLLCESVKSRATDELYICLERAKCHSALRERFARAKDSLLVDYASDTEEPLATRVLALWYLAGTQKFPSELMPPRTGSLEEAMKILRSLKKIPPGLVESCIGVMGKTQWPLSAFVPFIYQEVQKQKGQMQVKKNPLPPSPTVEEIPLHCCDMFTRTGQSSLRQLQRTVHELQAFNIKQLGTALFYCEGGLLDKTLTSPFLQELQLAGEMADAESVGLDVPDYLGLRDCLIRHADTLNHIRREQLQRYLNGASV
jgi:hypothetical protein